ncbi:hypothetical protein DXG03_001989 [Asterophora parasitica]|uniref:PHD-type domain-containing protein n=1 Tax=Asterophora parasitica TaxID=117018 RepID=A0A9P7GBB1_9AGAR|nr:hypothetical protein DXG03_001989 [Asterophora parasitica]
MAKLSVTEQTTKSKSHPRPHSYTPEPRPTQVYDTFCTTAINSRHSDPPPASSPHSFFSPPMSPPRPAAGGEMERIRQAALQDRLAHFQEAESRRPEYLKRTKRTFSEADSGALAEDESAQDPLVGITESPAKGRRLKLFQETSEESFEESLMAGGYGRYRTADWVRQPQPILLATPGSAGPSTIVSALERTEELAPPAPPTEKEIRKRQRLAAFQERTNGDGSAKLQPVELAGRGRVLLDIPAEGDDTSPTESPGKKRTPARRKKKGELTAREKKALALAAAASGDLPERPNWPDAEFPWRLRTEERAEELKAQDVEKMKAIERFLDRDSDDEEDEAMRREDSQEPARMGRGKMIPLSDHLGGSRPQARRKSVFFPTDPADARAALMSKKSVRTLSYRQQKRQRLEIDDESDDEVLCICNGRDDGRELVQCDGCETWYHLHCIGIKDITHLGKEEDPWFCHHCDRHRRLPSSEPELSYEPTFVPTDDRPRVSPSFDAPFFQPSSLQDSPMAWDAPRLPRTPDRNRGCEYEPELSSGSSWVNSSRERSSPPQYPAQDVRVYTNYNSFHPYDETPFDPSSTPSRGIKFGASFTTPKNIVWSSRTSGFFQTPSKGVGAFAVLKFKPPAQSLATYILEVQSKFSPSTPDLAANTSWRNVALSLERDFALLKEKYEAEKIRSLALENAVPPMSVPAAAPPNATSSEQPVPAKKKLKKKSASTSNVQPEVPPPPIDVKAVLAEIFPRVEMDVPRIASPLSLFSSLDDFLQLTSLPEVELDLLLSVTLRAIEALARHLTSVLNLPATTASDPDMLEYLGLALYHILTVVVPLLRPLQPSTSGSVKPVVTLLDRTTTLVLKPLIRAFSSKSESYLSALFLPPTDISAATPSFAAGNAKPPDAPRNAHPIDVRANMMSLFRTIFSVLDEQLQSFSPLAKPSLVSHTLRASLILETVREFDRLFSAAPSTSSRTSTDPSRGVGVDADNKQCRTRPDRVRKLATKDSLWFLCTILHILFGETSIPASFASQPVAASIIPASRDDDKREEAVGAAVERQDDTQGRLLSEGVSNALYRLITSCKPPRTSYQSTLTNERGIEGCTAADRARGVRLEKHPAGTGQTGAEKAKIAAHDVREDGDGAIGRCGDGSGHDGQRFDVGVDTDIDAGVNAAGQFKESGGSDQGARSVPQDPDELSDVSPHDRTFELDEVGYGMLLGVMERYWVWSKTWEL